MQHYEIIDVSGDAGLKVRGTSLGDLFANAALGMTELITNPAEISITEQKEVCFTSDTVEDLLVRWLNELVFLFDAHDFIGRMFNIRIQGNSLAARISGGRYDPTVHEKRLLIKAATYHKLTLRRAAFWEATIIFDI